MSDKNKFADKVISYLKFYKDYYNYDIYRSDIKVNKGSGVCEQINETSEQDSIAERSENARQIVQPLPENELWMQCETLDAFAAEIRDCTKCKLLARTRKQIVFGTGNPNADIVVVGEAPGADEDEQGKPFVGRAGKLLTDILNAINFTREEVYICNILKCRPPENRNPLPDEILNCEPYLFKQLEMVKPKLILAVGSFAAQTLLRTKEPLGRLRGKFHLYNGIKMMVTYHPAALLRNPNWKRPTWEDVQLFRKEYDAMKSV
jgi:DNA polymerase